MTTASKAAPTPEEFYINYPLYDSVVFNDDQGDQATDIKYFEGTIDAYCPQCGSHSIFKRNLNKKYFAIDAWREDKHFTVGLTCSRNAQHMLYFFFRVEYSERSMQKIGQFPSLAELNLYDVKKYAGVLDKTYLKELTKAIGLAAHGVGVGSFVYLRRIFESLIEEAHKHASLTPSWDEEAYAKARMADKIQLIANWLPDFLVDNKAIYGILSKGVHELTEDECLRAFPVVKLGIEIILDTKLRNKEEQKKIQEATNAIQKLAGAQKSTIKESLT